MGAPGGKAALEDHDVPPPRRTEVSEGGSHLVHAVGAVEDDEAVVGQLTLLRGQNRQRHRPRPGQTAGLERLGSAHIDHVHRPALGGELLQRVGIDREDRRAPRMTGGGRPAAGQKDEQRQAEPADHHGLLTVTVTLAVPVAFAGSRTVTTSVRWPFGVLVVTHGSVT